MRLQVRHDRNWVLAVDALMADGEIHTFGTPSVKCNTGPSLAQLLVGSEGAVRHHRGATVRLLPEPAQRLTLLLPMERWHDLLTCGPDGGGGYLPAAFEFWDPGGAPGPARPRSRGGPPDACEGPALLEFDDRDCKSERSWKGWWRRWAPWRSISSPPPTRASGRPSGACAA